MSYCRAINNMKGDELTVHKIYHDTQYGFPIEEDNELFCRLILEINQAGLSWTTILKKQDGFRKAYHNFNIKKVAAYKDKDIQRLLNDAGIIQVGPLQHVCPCDAQARHRLQQTGNKSRAHGTHGLHGADLQFGVK